ncbi:AfsR/SARP family transcriptional regulator [Asanoa iriomotensis]|uniref:SARP family transcriptional regulator n=1 Tax=Asanoa iriomotensis TaxID=234613 RepID=A0ABQ4C149_9ACTN|nr:BTAD domain-containing putative transcriptional regulator [Asanoa iriomotensis]GIF56489.1 SARP family transcriptional regulator [Asanoa iriomotensis]
MQAYVHGRPIPLGPRKQRFVLAVLALEANQVVSVDRLVELMWPQSPPRTAVHAVRVCASRLRSVLAGAELVRSGGGYMLHTDPLSIDAHRFRALTEQAREVEDDLDRVDILNRALALWIGPALAGAAPPDQCERLCRGLDEGRLVAIEDRADARLRLGHHRDVLDELTSLVAAHPTRERLVGQLVLALYRSGRPGDALRIYREARQHLADDLGLDPSAELQRIEIAILRGEADLEVAEPRALPSPADGRGFPQQASAPALLPPAVAGFTGRERYLATLDRLLAESESPAVPIAAISGPAGVGKTSLAIHWAHRVGDRFPGGQLYVNLLGFDDHPPMAPAEAIRIFLAALSVSPTRIPASQQAQIDLYRSLLGGTRTLVVLDNASSAEQARPLLPGAPGCVAVVTSRNDLAGLVAVEGARAMTLDVLTPEEGRLLLTRRLGAARVAADPAAVEAMTEISARLPLALAIIAAQAAMRPDFALTTLVADLRGRGNGLDPFELGDRSADIRTVFSWSYRRLSDGAARLFRLLGVHPGPDASTPALASLLGVEPAETAELVRELTRAHLLLEHVPGRYTCHDLLHAYSIELVGRLDSEPDRQAARGRLLDHYLHGAVAAADVLDRYRDSFDLPEPSPAAVLPRPVDHDDALGWLGSEYRALLAAIRGAAATGFDTHAWQIAGALAGYFERRGHWQDWAETQQVAHSSARRLNDPYPLALTHRWLGRVNEWLREYDAAQDHFHAALVLFTDLTDNRGQARTHHSLGRIAELQGRPADALRLTARGLELFRLAGDRPGQAKALNGVGWYHALLGDYREALRSCTEALAVLQDVGDRRLEANTRDSLGYIHHRLGDHKRAIASYRGAIALFQMLGDRFHEAEASVHLGDAYQAAGEVGPACEAWRRAVAVFDDLGHANAAKVKARLAQAPVSVR